MKRIVSILISFSLIISFSACSKSNDAQDACRELEILIASLSDDQLESLSQFHETVDAILVHARNAAQKDGNFAQLANKIQTFSSSWYARAGNQVPTTSEAQPLKVILNSYCQNI
jgi:hypothetical protein